MAPEAIKAIEHNIFTPGNYFYNGVGHVTVKYEEVLAIGYKGIIDKARAELEKCQVGDGNYAKKSHFLNAVIVSCQAVIEYAERYAELASQMAAECTDPVRKQELLQISENCSRVPANGATSFYEACQSFWFVQQLLQVESSGHSISPGRFDQYMYPYYKADIDKGVITREEMCIRDRGHSGSMDQSLSEFEIRHRILAREAAAEGIVLLKNEGVLPLSTASAIALLGSGAEKTIKGGIGSGDVNNRENISIYQGMKEAGVTITSENWLEDYEERYKNARNVWKEKILEDAKHVDNPFDAYASNPFILPEGRAVEAKDIADAKAAVYVLSRISGEGKDRRRVKGDYYLSEREAADLFFLNEKKIPVILLLNAGGPIELTDILENTENIKAILNISQPGQESGYAVADILLGNCVPSAKLTATWARRYEDCPFAEDYSYLNGNLDTEEYKEGIFVGYRYFDSFGKKPLFPFGFGLSYTEFKIEFKGRCV